MAAYTLGPWFRSSRHSFFVFFLFLCLFSGCFAKPPSSCFPPERELIFFSPKTSPDIHSPWSSEIQTEVFRAYGFFLENHQIVTAAHAVPPRAKGELGILEGDRDKNTDLLFLKTEFCGSPLSLSRKWHVGDLIFDCQSQEERGEIQGTASSVVENHQGETQLFSNLLMVSGYFSLGESGKPFCNKSGEVLGMLVSVTSEKGYLRKSEDIFNFQKSHID